MWERRYPVLAAGLGLSGQGIPGAWVGVWSRSRLELPWAQPCGLLDLDILHPTQKRTV